MKNLKFALCFLIIACAFQLSAQNVPQKFKYQGIAKFNGDIVNGDIGLQISILQNTPNGIMVYQERHSLSTNANGVFATEVGNGEIIDGNFSTIDWANGSYYLKVELDAEGGNEYIDLGWSELVSVPYAMHAGSVDDKDDADADSTNELQDLSIDVETRTLYLTNGENDPIQVKVPVTPPQNLELQGTTLTIEGGNAVDLNNLAINIDDADADPTNEIQSILVDTLDESPLNMFDQIFLDSLAIILSGTEDTVILYDSNPVNEFQTIEILDTTPSFASDYGYAELNLSPAIGPFIEVDASPINEIQELNDTLINTSKGKLTILELINPDGGIESTVPVFDTDFSNEIQELTNVIHDLSCSNKFELQIGHNEIDSAGNNKWVVDDSEFIPDPDPVNELQRLEIIKGLTTSQLNILSKVCIPDSLAPGLQRTEWRPFDSVVIDDTSPVNELQTLSFNPLNDILSISGGNQVKILNIPIWTETPSNDCVEYDGKAKADRFETTLGAVVADDTGISRYDPTTGQNVSNICLEKAGNTTWGKFEVLNNEDLVGNYQSCTHRAGILDIFGPNGNYNVLVGHGDGFPNNGLVGVVSSNNVLRAGMEITSNGLGSIFADIKNFRMPHPSKPNKEIWYASLEGPEAGAYERGTATLENGETFVPFSSHFKEVINPETMTVMLTPLSANTIGLAVIEKTATGFKVKELMNGNGNFEFDWEVKSVRKSFENYEVVRNKIDRDFSHTRVGQDN